MTIKEIAKLASVSAGTVDRVIHNRGYVDAEKRVLIQKIIEESGFRPNLYARNLKHNQVTRVGFLTPMLSTENGYWDLVYQGVMRAQEDLLDVSFVVETYEYDRKCPGSFTEVAERMASSNLDGCVVIAKCPDEAHAFFLKHTSLKYIFLDSSIPDTQPLCTISQDFFQGGFLAGKLISILQPNASRILTFSFLDSLASKERIRGFKEFFHHSSIVEDMSVDSKEMLQKTLCQYLNEKGLVDAIFSPCSLGYIIGSEMSNLGLRDKIKIVTYDLIPENRKALQNGTVDCVLSQRPVYQGYAGIFQIYRYLVQNQSIEDKIDVQIDVVFQENLPRDFRGTENGRINSYCIPSTFFG